MFAGRVLCLIEDDKRIGKRAAAHKSKRSDLDDALFEHLRDLFGIDQVEQGVVKRPQVRVDLFLKVARQKAEAFAGLDRGASQDYAADLLFEQGIDGHRHCQIALAGSCNADAKDEVVGGDRIKIFSLIGRLWSDLFLAGRIESGSQEMILQAVRPILGYLFESVTQFLIGKRVALVKQLTEIDQYLLDGFDIAFVPVDQQFVAAGTDTDVEQSLEILDVLILDAKERVKALRW